MDRAPAVIDNTRTATVCTAAVACCTGRAIVSGVSGILGDLDVERSVL